MEPTITIDKDAIRFERDDGGENYFFKDLFRFPNNSWHREVLESLHKCYIECVKQDIELENPEK